MYALKIISSLKLSSMVNLVKRNSNNKQIFHYILTPNKKFMYHPRFNLLYPLYQHFLIHSIFRSICVAFLKNFKLLIWNWEIILEGEHVKRFPTFTSCLKSKLETLEKGVKYVQKYNKITRMILSCWCFYP